MNSIHRLCLLWFALFIFGGGPAIAGEALTVGVAANFIAPFEEIARIYEKRTGVEVHAVFTSTGNLYAQIENGAPYDCFLAADESRPALLTKKGLADPPFVYATGQLVLWSAGEEVCRAKNWQDVFRQEDLGKVAIANPETAPYGAAAVEALRAAGLWEAVQPRLVQAQSVAQVFQYAHTGAVDAGFCALSSARSEEGEKGCWFPVKEAPPVRQAACVLKRACLLDRARDFAGFLLGPEAAAIKKRYGYH